jgi:hypothetical protein
MNHSAFEGIETGPVDPDGDPELKQSVSQPDQAEGADDPAQTESD